MHGEGNLLRPIATEDDGGVAVAGCLLPFACNYTQRGLHRGEFVTLIVWDARTRSGNYDPRLWAASACEYPAIPFLDCDGNCLNDSDEDGVCDEQEILAAHRRGKLQSVRHGRQQTRSARRMCVAICLQLDRLTSTCPGSCGWCLFGTVKAMQQELACLRRTDEPCCSSTPRNTCVQVDTMLHVQLRCCTAYNDGSCEFSTCQVFGCNVDNVQQRRATVNDGAVISPLASATMLKAAPTQATTSRRGHFETAL